MHAYYISYGIADLQQLQRCIFKIHLNLTQILPHLFWHQVGFFNRVDFADNRVERGTNRVDYYYNRADSEQNRVVFSTELILRTVELDETQIESIIESFFSTESIFRTVESNVTQIESILSRIESFLSTESILRTVESNVTQIESILITMESILSRIESFFFFNRVDFADSRVERGANRVDSGDAHNTFLESTILKQTACYNVLVH